VPEAGSGRKAEGQIRGASHDVNAEAIWLFALKNPDFSAIAASA
jgi:hypothetical protein